MASILRLAQANLYDALDERVGVTTSINLGIETRRYVHDPGGRLIGEYGASAADVVAETIWLQPEVAANDNDPLSLSNGQPLGGDDGVGGEVYPELAEWTPLALATGAGGSASLSWVHGNHLGVPLLYADGSGAPVTPAAHSMPGFPGQLRTLADLYYNRHRDYDSSTGRYIQADPIGLEGGVNLYLYAEGNPLRYVDPDGLNPWAIGAGVCRVAPQPCAAVGAAVASSVCYITGACQQASKAVRRATAGGKGEECHDEGGGPCERAKHDARSRHKKLIEKRIPHYQSGGTRGPDSKHYRSILELQAGLKDAIRRVKLHCRVLPPELPEWGRAARQRITPRH